eukprot:scaffold8448_cov188-Skeletonema_menzelii.AAC.2
MLPTKQGSCQKHKHEPQSDKKSKTRADLVWRAGSLPRPCPHPRTCLSTYNHDHAAFLAMKQGILLGVFHCCTINQFDLVHAIKKSKLATEIMLVFWQNFTLVLFIPNEEPA